MKSENLLIFSYDYPPSDGGIARLCQEIATGMHPYYRKVTVLTREKSGISKPYNYDAVKVVKLPPKRLICELAAWWYLLRIADKKNTDVLCGLWHPEAAIALLAGIPNTFILAHGTEYLSGTSSFRRKYWLPFYGRWVLKNARKVIANSHYTQKLTQAVCPEAKTVALPLAVNPQYFRPMSTRKEDGFLKLCTVSRVLQFKGHDFIARTIASLPNEVKQKIRWNIAGTGSYLEALKSLVQEIGIDPLVHFHGFVSDQELPGFYSANDVFILCTREQADSTSVEGFGLVFLEAQACGTPAIGARTGGIPDAVIPGEGGWLINQDNTEELSALLQSLIDQPESVTAQALAGRKRVENTANWSYYCSQLKNIFNR